VCPILCETETLNNTFGSLLPLSSQKEKKFVRERERREREREERDVQRFLQDVHGEQYARTRVLSPLVVLFCRLFLFVVDLSPAQLLLLLFLPPFVFVFVSLVFFPFFSSLTF